MKTNLFLSLIVVCSLLVVQSCVSISPATGNYPITGDVLEAWVDGIPYEVLDEKQYFRSVKNKENNVGILGIWIDVDKKGDWSVLYNVITETSSNSLSDRTPPTPTSKFAQLEKISYVERPYRR